MSIRKIILKKLKIENFKGIAKGVFDFTDKVNKISAENGSGKTTIKYAWEWVLGQNTPDVLPTLNNKEIQDLETSVEAIVNIEGYDYILKRISKGKYVLNKETNTRNKASNENTYSVDGIEMTLRNYQDKLGGLLGNGAYSNIVLLTDKEFFNNNEKFKWSDRRKMLFDIAGVDNSVDSILESGKYDNIKEYIVKGYATSDIKSMFRREKAGYKDQQNKNNILIAQKTEELTELKSINFEDLEKEIKKSKDKLAKLQEGNEKEIKSEKIQELQEKLLELQKEKSELEMNDIAKKNNLTRKANEAYSEASELKREYDNLKIKHQNIEHKILHLTDIEENCPVCKRKKDKEVLENLEADREKELNTLNKEKETIEEKLTKLRDEYNDKKAEYDKENKKAEGFKQNAKIKELEEQSVALKSELEQAKQENTSNLPTEEIRLLEIEISSLERELGKRDFISQGENYLKSWKDNNLELADNIISVELREQQLTDYVREQVEIISATVNSKFENGVSWALFKETYKDGDGGIEEDCTLMYNNKRYSALSTGERNIANLETLRVLQEHFEVNIVVFSDNAETITIPYKVDMQLVELHAVKNEKLKVVKIEDIYGEKKEKVEEKFEKESEKVEVETKKGS